MKLTNEQRFNNSTIRTGVRALQNKLLKLGEDITFEEETIRLNSKLDTELSKAKVTVAEESLFILNGMVEQLTSCINMLESNLIK